MRNFNLLSLGLAFALATSGGYAQSKSEKEKAEQSKAAQEKAERAVQITQGPSVTDVTGTSATVKWTTNNVSSNHVRYRPASGGEWKSGPQHPGSKDHSVHLSGLTPGTKYEYQILTRDGDVRSSGQFETTGASAAESGMDPAERNVHITQGPTVTHITGSSAVLKWTTDRTAANNVQYRPSSGGEWKKAWVKEGSKEHWIPLKDLKTNETYEYQILTRDGTVRTSGQFKTASTATGTMPDVTGTPK